MRYALTPEQKKFFERYGAIAFEELWEADFFEGCRNAVTSVLAMRLSGAVPAVPRATLEQSYAVGRDLWRSSVMLKKALASPTLGELAAELLNVLPLRLAYDQYLPCYHGVVAEERYPAQIAEPQVYANLLERTAFLEGISSVQGMVGGILICLCPPSSPGAPAASTEGVVPWPEHAGGGVFFKASMPLDFTFLKKNLGGKYILLAYCRERSVYVLQNGDPQVHALKHVGYALGDRLNDKLNPIVAR